MGVSAAGGGVNKQTFITGPLTCSLGKDHAAPVNHHSQGHASVFGTPPVQLLSFLISVCSSLKSDCDFN